MSEIHLAVQPSISLHPGPLYISEGSNVTLPSCHVTGHPDPDVKWSKSFGQLPLGRVLRNNEVMRIADVRKADSGDYICTATNLLGIVVRKTILMVVSLPRFTMKPPVKAFARTGDSLTLNCSATGDPQPVISWKRQGSPLPAGRNQLINGALVIRDVRKKDAGIYICVATSAGVFDIETVTLIEILHKGKIQLILVNEMISTNHRKRKDSELTFQASVLRKSEYRYSNTKKTLIAYK